MKEIYPEIKIEIVITNFRKSIRNEFVIKEKTKYETVMFEIEELYYKQRIGKSNKRMVDECNTLICYVRPNAWRSGAKTALDYVVRKGLKIINLYSEELK